MIDKLKARSARARKAVAGFLSAAIPGLIAVLGYVKLPERWQWVPPAIAAAIPVLVWAGVYQAPPNDPAMTEVPPPAPEVVV